MNKRSHLLALLVAAAAASSLQAQVVIERVLVDPSGNESRNDTPEFVVIRNMGTETVPISGWSLLSSPPADALDTWAFPEGMVIGPGSSITLAWYTLPEYTEEGQVATGKANLSLLNNDGGDLALVSPDGIQHYVQWARAGQALEAQAVDAGCWTAGEAVAAPTEGLWLVYDGDGYTAADWTLEESGEGTAVSSTSWAEAKQLHSR